jgi:hypothetical protein
VLGLTEALTIDKDLLACAASRVECGIGEPHPNMAVELLITSLERVTEPLVPGRPTTCSVLCTSSAVCSSSL